MLNLSGEDAWHPQQMRRFLSTSRKNTHNYREHSQTFSNSTWIFLFKEINTASWHKCLPRVCEHTLRSGGPKTRRVFLVRCCDWCDKNAAKACVELGRWMVEGWVLTQRKWADCWSLLLMSLEDMRIILSADIPLFHVFDEGHQYKISHCCSISLTG